MNRIRTVCFGCDSMSTSFVMQGDGDTQADRCSLTPDLNILPALDNARPPRSEHLTGTSNAGLNLDCRIITQNPGRLHSKPDVCLQADRREYRLGLSHLVYFLELVVDGRITIHGLIRKSTVCAGAPFCL
jgi:hypothetical protein